jgi:hypothetical protein
MVIVMGVPTFAIDYVESSSWMNGRTINCLHLVPARIPPAFSRELGVGSDDHNFLVGCAGLGTRMEKGAPGQKVLPWTAHQHANRQGFGGFQAAWHFRIVSPFGTTKCTIGIRFSL